MADHRLFQTRSVQGRDSVAAVSDEVATLKVTEYELRAIAVALVEGIYATRWDIEVDRIFGDWDVAWLDIAAKRLADIRHILGEEKFEDATRDVEARWKRDLAEFEPFSN